jgi:ribonuclease-3
MNSFEFRARRRCASSVPPTRLRPTRCARCNTTHRSRFGCTRTGCPLRAVRRASIVSTVGLARLAGRIDLGPSLSLGEGEAQRGGRLRPSILASAFEALAGALYLDVGYVVTRDWLLAIAAPEISLDAPLSSLKSPKSRLQEYTQRRSGSRPEYHVVDATGPDHEKLFQVEVLVDGRPLGVGVGPSRRVAETAAAQRAMETLRAEAGDRSVRPGPATAASEHAG